MIVGVEYFLCSANRVGRGIVNWQIAAIGLLGLIALSDFHTPLLKASPNFLPLATFASLHVAVGFAYSQ